MVRETFNLFDGEITVYEFGEVDEEGHSSG